MNKVTMEPAYGQNTFHQNAPTGFTATKDSVTAQELSVYLGMDIVCSASLTMRISSLA